MRNGPHKTPNKSSKPRDLKRTGGEQRDGPKDKHSVNNYIIHSITTGMAGTCALKVQNRSREDSSSQKGQLKGGEAAHKEAQAQPKKRKDTIRTSSGRSRDSSTQDNTVNDDSNSERRRRRSLSRTVSVKDENFSSPARKEKENCAEREPSRKSSNTRSFICEPTERSNEITKGKHKGKETKSNKKKSSESCAPESNFSTSNTGSSGDPSEGSNKKRTKRKHKGKETKGKEKNSSESRGSKSKQRHGSSEKGHNYRKKPHSRESSGSGKDGKMKSPSKIAFQSINWGSKDFKRMKSDPPASLKSILIDSKTDSPNKSTKFRVKFDKQDPTINLIPTLDHKEKRDLFVSKKEIKINKIMEINRKQNSKRREHR